VNLCTDSPAGSADNHYWRFARGQIMHITADNETYEVWLRQQCDVVEADLKYKHRRMRKDAFTFLRATYFRWAQRIEKICPNLAAAPQVLAVGDTHVENFGTWRDREGRLVWGVNDFDDAANMPYASDLVRLTTSARLAPDLRGDHSTVADHILEGYRHGLATAAPTLLDEQEIWMRAWVACSDKDRAKFWADVETYPTAVPPVEVAEELARSLPEEAVIVRYATRRKGGGGLGRPRYIAIAAWRGGRIVREAKAVVPSAWDWAHGVGAPVSRVLDVAMGRTRSPDAHMSVARGFVIRRIAADSRKIDVGDLTGGELRARLLRAMGSDLGAIHAAKPAVAAAIGAHLDGGPADWLKEAAKVAADEVQADYRHWCEQPAQCL
jgi:uncharacterized protein (DUF2252 family)